MRILAILSLGCAIHHTLASGSHHYGNTDSNNIHSNDTLELVLSNTMTDVLRGTPGSVHQLDFIFTNRGGAGYFEFLGKSEDGLQGILPKGSKFVSSGGQQTVSVYDLTVPDYAPRGSRLSYSLTARKSLDNGRNKRGAESPSDGHRNNHPDGPPYDYLGQERRPTGQARPPVNLAQGCFPGDKPNGGSGYYPGNQPYRDPAERDSITLSVKFTVVSEAALRYHETKEPWITMKYSAQRKEETCQSEPDDGTCNREWWFVKFLTADEDSGLNLINVEPLNQRPNYGQAQSNVYYRYETFPIGDVKEQEVLAGATCCVEGLLFEVTDVAGNKANVAAYSSGTGTGALLSDSVLYGIIGGTVALILTIFGVAVYCCYKNKYRSVPTN